MLVSHNYFLVFHLNFCVLGVWPYFYPGVLQHRNRDFLFQFLVSCCLPCECAVRMYLWHPRTDLLATARRKHSKNRSANGSHYRCTSSSEGYLVSWVFLPWVLAILTTLYICFGKIHAVWANVNTGTVITMHIWSKYKLLLAMSSIFNSVMIYKCIKVFLALH